MKTTLFSSLALLLIFSLLSGCAPMRDAAGTISGDIGEVSDELGKERVIGEGEDVIVVEPMADKKIKMAF